MGRLKEAGKDYVAFWKEGPVVAGLLTLVFGGFVVFLLVILPMLVVNHYELKDRCEAKGGIVLKSSDGWTCIDEDRFMQK